MKKFFNVILTSRLFRLTWPLALGLVLVWGLPWGLMMLLLWCDESALGPW